MKRGFDQGRLALLVLAGSLALNALLVAAELSGFDGLCLTQADEAVFTIASVLSCGCLALAFLLREGRAFRYPLWASASTCLFLVLYFPLTPVSWMVFLAYVALPASIYFPAPKGFLVAAAGLAACCAARFIVLPPEALGQRAASFRDVLAFVAVPLAASALLSGLAAFRKELDRLEEALLAVTKLNLSYQDYNASLEEKSALEERLRLTRDIHDAVGYALTNTIMTMRAASIMLSKDPERVPALLESARRDADQALAQVRGILGVLRRREIRSAAGPNAIAKAARAFRMATGVEVDVDYGNFDWTVPGEAAFATSHFVQEGMLNAISHGKASSIRVSFRASEEGLLLVSVKDNGEGAKEVQEGIGIAGMRERIERLGGSIAYGSSGSGFCIEMRLPLAAPLATAAPA
jgi:signal transduction histidine kinase